MTIAVDHHAISVASRAARRPTRFLKPVEDVEREREAARARYLALGGLPGSSYHAVPPPPELSVPVAEDPATSFGVMCSAYREYISDEEWARALLGLDDADVPIAGNVDDESCDSSGCVDYGDSELYYDADRDYYGGGGLDHDLGPDPYDDGTNYYGDDWGYSEPVDGGDYGSYSYDM